MGGRAGPAMKFAEITWLVFETQPLQTTSAPTVPGNTRYRQAHRSLCTIGDGDIYARKSQ